MKIGVPKEIKNHEYRVGMVPGSVRELVNRGHEVFVETEAGAGIGMHDYEFSDGDPPPPDIINKWLDLVEQRFKFIKPRSGEDASDACIAVHCVAGLGRAPMLVAVALIEAGLDPFDAVQFIRKKRRGAINDKQFRFLEAYKPTRRGAAACCCVVS